MKVLFIAGWYPSEHNPIEGIPIKEYALAASISNEVAVIYGRKEPKQKEPFTFQIETEDRIPTLRFTYRRSLFSTNSFSAYPKGVLLAFEKLLGVGFKPDIIHANVYFTGIPASIIKKAYGIPYVLTERLSFFPRKLLKNKDVKRAKKGMKNAQFILPVSKYLEVAIRKYGIKGNFEVLPNTVNTEIFYPSKEYPKRKTGEILTVARLVPVKNYPFLFSALKKLKNNNQNNFQLRIIGDGKCRKEYEDLVNNLGLKNEVAFLGNKTKSEIANLMRKSDFFVLPSFCETFGCVLIEAMACGLPIVATCVGGVPEIVNDETGILVESNNVEKLAGAISYMLEHYTDYSREKIAGYAREMFSYQIVGRKLSEIYRQVLRI